MCHRPISNKIWVYGMCVVNRSKCSKVQQRKSEKAKKRPREEGTRTRTEGGDSCRDPWGRAVNGWWLWRWGQRAEESYDLCVPKLRESSRGRNKSFAGHEYIGGQLAIFKEDQTAASLYWRRRGTDITAQNQEQNLQCYPWPQVGAGVDFELLSNSLTCGC